MCEASKRKAAQKQNENKNNGEARSNQNAKKRNAKTKQQQVKTRDTNEAESYCFTWARMTHGLLHRLFVSLNVHHEGKFA